jgi:hypothetical protein
MPIFLLTPQKLDAGDWAMSTGRKPVYVEADNEQQARARAAIRYSLLRRHRPRDPIGAFAWRMSTLVTARIVDAIEPGLEFIRADGTTTGQPCSTRVAG